MRRVDRHKPWLPLGIGLTLVCCARSPATDPTSAEPNPEVVDCVEPPQWLGRDLNRPLEITACTISLEPPTLDIAARARAIETINALGVADPHSLLLANDVAFSELAAANWEGLDDPVVHERLRSTIALLEPLVHHDEAHVNSSIHTTSLAALMCAHAVLGEAQRAQAYAQAMLTERPGMWLPTIYLTLADLGDEETAIRLNERAAEFDEYYKPYANYRVAWTLLHPTIVDQDRAVQLLEEVLVGETWPRLGRLLRHRAAAELRALGREVEVPDLLCVRSR